METIESYCSGLLLVKSDVGLFKNKRKLIIVQILIHYDDDNNNNKKSVIIF